MNDKQFDELMQQKLGSYSSDVPGNMWQRIEKKKKRDRLFFFLRWYALGALLLLTVLSGYYFISLKGDKKNKTVKENKILKDNETKDNKNIAENNSDKIHDSVTLSLNNSSSDKNLSLSKSDNKTTILIHHSVIRADDKTWLKNKTKTFSIQSGNITNDHTTNVTVFPQIVDSSIDMHKEPIHDQSQTGNKKSIPKMEQSSANIMAAGDTKDEVIESTTKNELPKNYLSLEIFVSPDIPFVHISSNDQYDVLRKNVAKEQLSFSFGARLSAPMMKNFFWKTGFQFSQVNERFNYQDSANNLYTSSNHFKTLDIPILLGYEKTYSQFKISASAGLLVNIHSKYSGKIINPLPEVVDVNSGGLYKQNMGTAIYLGAAINTQLNKKLHVFAEPHFNFRLGSMASTYQPFKQKINVAGISFGLRYDLFKK